MPGRHCKAIYAVADYAGKQISKKFCICDKYVINLFFFASMKLEKGHKKNYLALVFKLCYTMIFYEMG